MGILGGSKNKKSGKCHELSRKSVKKIDPDHPGGPGGWGSKIKKCGTFHELTRKSITKKFHPPGAILGGEKIKSPGNVMNCREKKLI